ETFSKFQEFNDPFASLEQIAQGVSKDVVFSSKVLRAANSAYFGYAEEVTSVQHAVRILGYNNLKTLYFREHFRMLDSSESNASHRRGLWKHAMLTAVAANHIASAFGRTMPETAFTLGLMHDIGKFILCQMPMHEEGHKRVYRVLDWEPVVRTSDDLSISVDLERKLLGVDHCLLGKMAMDDWELPELMARVVHHHHSGHYAAQEMDEETQAYVAVVHAADFIARVFEHRGDTELPPGGSLEPEFIAMTSRPAMEKAVLGGTMHQELLNAEALAQLS
ncbi:MAG: HDOD domain-containing protein, partial [Oceanidesulfovibrio sp.]